MQDCGGRNLHHCGAFGLLDVLISLAIRVREATCEETASERCGRRHDDRCLILEIEDEGIGMTGDVRSCLYEPFYTTKDDGHAGIGLTKVYSIVHQNGGWIDPITAEGIGTTFRVYLPMDNTSAEIPVEAAVELPVEITAEIQLDVPETVPVEAPVETITTQHRRSGDESQDPTVLFVEDEYAIRCSVSEYLEMSGFKMLCAASAEEAIDLMSARESGVDVVLTDVLLPGMNGKQLVDHLRSQMPSVKVVYTSGYSDDIVGRAEIAAQNATFLAKPYSFAELVEVLNERDTGHTSHV